MPSLRENFFLINQTIFFPGGLLGSGFAGYVPLAS